MTDPRQQLIMERLRSLRNAQERIEHELGEASERDEDSRSEQSDESGHAPGS